MHEATPTDLSFDLVVLCGMPGVGKLTVARDLHLLTGYALFHNHLVVDAVMSLFPFGSPPFVDLRESLWLQILGKAAREGTGGVVFTFAYDRTVDTRLMFKLQDAVAAPGRRVSWVELACDDDALQSRVTNEGRQRYQKLSSLSQFLALQRGGAFPPIEFPVEPLVIETTRLAASEAAEKIAERLALPLRA